ncbi:MAG: hypothetical protein NTY38_07625 [Acidobacteria bacterium]|nr:hypothetical protein [Acidobacteriota bacterium]
MPVVVLAALFAPWSRAAEQGQLDASPALFSVLAAINAAGYDAEVDSPSNSPLRAQVRAAIRGREIPCLPELKEFYRLHRQADPGADLTQYIYFALSVTDPPEFKIRQSQNLIHPAVVALEGFDRLMAKFHKEAGIDELWRRSRPAYDQVIARYHEPVTRGVLEVSGYVRSVTSGFLGRRFQIYIDLLGAPNLIQSLSYVNEYFVVVTPSAEVRSNDIRHAYLHYLLDPLATKYAENVNKKKPLVDFAQGAGALEDYYKEDFLLLTTESLIKAIEARLAAPAERSRLANQALTEGFILTPYFYEALPLYEKDERSMRLYFSDMVDAINLKKETQRLDRVQFAATKTQRTVKAPVVVKPVLTGAAKTLEEAEGLYSAKELEQAKAKCQRVLEQTDDRGQHSRAFFGLARIAALQRDPELADKLFRKTLELGPAVDAGSWSHIFLARLAGAAGEREEANQHFRSALAMEGISPRARQAAEEGLRETSPKK